MPVLVSERETIQKIAGEFEKLARALRAYPAAPAGADASRTATPALSILRSVEQINATLAEGARRGGLSPADFTALGRGFEEIATTLQAQGSGSRQATKKPTRKTATKTTKKTKRR